MTALLGLLVGLAALLAWDLSGLDLVVSQWFGSTAGFPAREAWWARALLHDGLRNLWTLAWLLLAFDALRCAPVRSGPPRGARRVMLGVGLLLLLLAPALKSQSHTSCPWSLAMFGSDAAWVPHWDWLTRDGGPGHCFPSGHATGAFAFWPLALLWCPWKRWPLALMLLGGLLATVGQTARGAHFLSHSLWSAWGCAVVAYSVNGLWAMKALIPRPSVNRLGD